MLCRASSLAPGATASSKSRKTWSAGNPWAFPSILTLEPGTARQDRRGRSGGTEQLLQGYDDLVLRCCRGAHCLLRGEREGRSRAPAPAEDPACSRYPGDAES